jgi:hypothetical protein
MPMAARSMAGVIYDKMNLTYENTIDNPCRLNFQVERSYASISFSGDNEIPLYDKVTDPTDGDHPESAYDGKNKIGNIKLLSYYVINKTNEYYTYRHVGSIEESGATSFPSTTMDNGYSAKYGPIGDDAPALIEPYTDQKTSSATFADGYWNMYGWAFKHTNEFKKLTVDKTYGDKTVTVPAEKYSGLEYIAENSMTNEAQTKTQATGVVFKVMIVPTEYYATDEPTLADSDFGTAALDDDTNLYKVTGAKYCFSDLYYYEGVFFADLDALKTYNSGDTNVSSVDDSTYGNAGIKLYKGAEAYYEYFIRHNNNYKYEEMDDMEFAIVRNNCYDLTLLAAAMSPYNSLYAGNDPSYDDPDKGTQDSDPSDGSTPDTDPDFPNPNTPTPCESPTKFDYLKVTVTVRPWTQHTIPSALTEIVE